MGELNQSGIYVIVNKANGHRYVGQTINFRKRFIQHRTKTHLWRSVIGRAIRKHGKDAFEFMVLERCAVDSLDPREVHHIAVLQPEYNMTPGGTGTRGHVVTPKTRALLAKKSRAWWDRLGQQQKQEIVARLKPHVKGTIVPPETRAQISQTVRRYWANNPRGTTSALQKRRASEVNRILLIGNQRGNKAVDRVDETGHVIASFQSLIKAAQAHGIHPSNISHVLKGGQTKAAGFAWKYHAPKEEVR